MFFQDRLDSPWARAFDCFRIHLLPIGELTQEGDLIAVWLSISGQRYAEEKITVLADNIDKERDDERRLLISMVLKDGSVVMPAPDARLGLPGLLLQLIGK